METVWSKVHFSLNVLTAPSKPEAQYQLQPLCTLLLTVSEEAEQGIREKKKRIEN